MARNPFDQFDSASGANPFDAFDQPTTTAERPGRTVLGTLGDIGVISLKGAVGLPQALMGIADLVSGGQAGKDFEEAGLRFKDAQKILDDAYSPAQQAANREVQAADGFVGTTKAAIENPSVIATTVGESLPQMLGGAAIARGGLAVSSKLAPWAAGAIGEGIMGAGSAAEQIRSESADGLLTGKQTAASIASGVGTAAIGGAAGKFAGSKLGQRLGLSDVDTMLAAGQFNKTPAGFIRQVVGSGISEGVLEELPQSVQEQMWQNYAQYKPLLDGVGKAGALGMLAGMSMGGAAGGFNAAQASLTKEPEPVPTPAPTAPPGPDRGLAVDVTYKAPDGQTVTSTGSAPAVATSDTTEAEKALRAPVTLTALDRVNEIDSNSANIRDRLSEISPENGYGPAFDTERQDLAAQAAELDVERTSIASTWPTAVKGAPASFSTESGARLDGEYALMDAADLVTSHDEGLRQNPLYPQELQPRDRSRNASELQVSNIVQKLDPARLGLSADAATGAPIVGADGLIESGNARTIAMKRVYQANGQKAEDYKAWLRANAAQFGLTPEAVDGMPKPVLVRVRGTPVNRAEFARQANASTVQRMSPSEQAVSDARRLASLDGLNPDEEGNFISSHDFIRQFMATLPITEQSDLIESDGRLSTAGYRRVQNAVLARAYGDSPSLRRMTESLDNNLVNVSKALLRVAPTIAAARERMEVGTLHAADIAPDLLAAVEGVSALKEKGWTVAQELAQTDLSGPRYTPEAADLLAFLADNVRSPRRIAEFVQRYYEALELAGDPSQPSMFGDDGPAPARADLLKKAQGTTNGAGTKDDAKSPGQDAQRGVHREGAQADEQGGRESKDAPGSRSGDQGDGAAPTDAGRGQQGKPARDAANDGTSEWVAFPADSGTLGIPRRDMPQIKAQHRGALMNFLEARGIEGEKAEVSADSLKPTQAEFSRVKVERFMETGPMGERSVLVSSDGYVLDGHHQWMAAKSMGVPVPVIRLGSPIRELLANVYAFPSVQQSHGAELDPRALVVQEFKDAVADLAQIASRYTRAAMIPEKTPDLMPTLVKLFEAAIRLIGTDTKRATAWVKAQLKQDPRFKTFWNKIGPELYQKAAMEAVNRPNRGVQAALFDAPSDAANAVRSGPSDDLAAAVAPITKTAKINGRPYDIARDNFKAPDVGSFMSMDALAAADKAVADFPPPRDQATPMLGASDRARAEALLAPVLTKAADAKAEFDQKIIDIAQRTGSLGQQLAKLKGLERGAEKLAIEKAFKVRGMKDLLRATIVVKTYADAQAVMDDIEREFTLLGMPKNRTGDAQLQTQGQNVPAEDPTIYAGYSDIMINVVMPNGTIAEIQINTPEMLAAKAAQGHTLYESLRVEPVGSAGAIEIKKASVAFYAAARSASTNRREAAAAESSPAGSSEIVMPPDGGRFMSGRGSRVSPSSDSSNQPLSGNSANQSPPNVGTKREPSGNLSGTLMETPFTDIVDRAVPESENDDDSRLSFAGALAATADGQSRGTSASVGMPVADLRALADRLRAAMPNMPTVNVLTDPSEAPYKLREYINRQDAWDDVEGAMHNGELYLFASGLQDEARAEHVLAEHEAGHFGLRAVLGPRGLSAAMRMVWLENAAVRKVATQLQKRGKLSDAAATEEVIVDLPSAQLVALKGWRKVVLKARDYLDARGYSAISQRLTAWLDGSLTQQQRADLFVADLVRAARDYVRGARAGSPHGYLGVTRLSSSLADDLTRQEQWLNAEARARGFKDIDDLVDRNYPVFEKLAALWREKNPADEGVMLSRSAPAAAAKTAAERADELIQAAVPGGAPLDAIARGLTRATGLERLTGAIYDRAALLLDRYTPDRIKAGVVSDFGVPEAVIDQRTMLQGRQRVQLRKAGALIEKLATLTRAESRVAYEWMNLDGSDPQAYVSMMQGLPEESVKVLQEVQKMIDKLSQDAVRLGQLDPEAFQRNRFAYLRRSYAKHTLEQTAGEKAKRARTIAVLGEQYKGRGMSDSASMDGIKSRAPEWWGRKLKAGKADTALKGEQFVRLERRVDSGEGTKPLDGMEDKPVGKLREVVYIPVGERIPPRFAEWTQAGTWEVRDVKGANAIMWRDFTKAEREQMGEVDESRFAIAKTLHAMIHDVEVGRYLEWLAATQAKKEGETIPGVVVDASERMRDTFAPGEWVRVPDSKIQGTAVLKYGKLAGRYLPGPVWNDLRQVVAGGRFRPFGETYAKVLSLWKTSKTALSPAVHMNNVMSNFVMADWHDVRAAHVSKALRILLAAGQKRGGIFDREAAVEVLNRYKDSGGDAGSWVTQEISRDQIQPLLESLEKELAASADGGTTEAQTGVYAALQHAMHLRFPQAWDAAVGSRAGKTVTAAGGALLDMYQAEDDVFRLAAWLAAKEGGANDLDAGKRARKSFLDYSINAPWINAMRASAWPFLSFTYRAVPMLLETAARKPHKLMKLMAIAGGLNALGTMMAGGGGDDERKMLPEEKAGSIWGMVPKLVRMPWNDQHGSPVYLDIRRWIPVGDVLDVGQGHAAVPILPGLMPGGPLVLMGEVVLNKSAFTGKPITMETDTPAQKVGKFIDYLSKAFLPNILLPNPAGYAVEAATGVPNAGQTYAWTGVKESLNGRTDAFGRELSTTQAVGSSFGVKLGSYPADVMRRNLTAAALAQSSEIEKNIAQLKRQRQTGRIDDAEFQSLVEVEQQKKVKLMRKLAEKTQ